MAACVTALFATGCGGGEEATPDRREARIPRALAADLAAKSEAVAARLEAGDVCGAAHLADDLEDAAARAVEERRLPAPYRRELLREARALQNEVNCPQPAPAPPAPPAPEEEEQATEKDEGDTKGKGDGKGKAEGEGEDKGKGGGQGEGGATVTVDTGTVEEGDG